MEKVLDQILNELKGIREGQERLDTRVGHLEIGQDRMGGKVDSIDERQERLESKVSSIDERQERLESKVSSIDERQERLESKVSSIDVRQERLEGKVNSVDIKVDNLKTSLIEGFAPYFKNVEKHIDNSNEKILNTIQKQQDSIDLLSTRSIQQEAEIKAMERVLKNQ